jgi:hypothetical protein
MRPRALAQLGDHVGIDEEAHSATRRARGRLIAKSASSPTSGIASR